MKYLINLFQIIWRIYFFVVSGLLVIITSPIILIVVYFNKIYSFNKLKRFGANIILWLLGLIVKVEGEKNIDYKKQYILIANHVSVLDILLMIKIFKAPFVFVGKIELSKFPIFGYFYKKTNITVNRNSPRSKKEVYDQVSSFTKKGLSVVIYPEGTIPEEKIILAPFKNGAFRIAIEHKLPILPFVFYDNKKRFPYRWTGGGPGKLRIKILSPVKTDKLSLKDISDLRDFTYSLIYTELSKDKFKQ